MNTLRRRTGWCLLLILGATAVWIYWPGNRAVATIERAGGTVQVLTSPENRGALAVTLPDTVTDADLEGMTALDKLQPVWVQLRGRQITGRGLACLKRLPSLRGLTLYGTSITDDDLIHLKAFPELATLNLDGSRITSRGLEHLKELPGLRSLSVRFTTLTAAAVGQLQADRPDLVVLSEFTDKADDD